MTYKPRSGASLMARLTGGLLAILTIALIASALAKGSAL